jgi:recombinational DNA repair ATPase RecF/endogenous inhibitor of DNA gyrase (YacG/DUF329 family)
LRIEAIELSWFRGAAEKNTLLLESKSAVIYGPNGSGKSSFVDAVEYAIKDGRIDHLAHEYSGRRQEKGIINTHMPKGKKAQLRIKFQGGTELRCEIERNGTARCRADSVTLSTWDYQRTVLRQDEVANFIRETKGGKYSALLPLLGLHEMEVAAENLRQLVKSIEKKSRVNEERGALKVVEAKQKQFFGAANYDQILKQIEDLHTIYCSDKTHTQDPLARCKDLEDEIKTRIGRFSADQKKHLALQDIASLDLKGSIRDVNSASLKLAGSAEPLIQEQLEVLRSAHLFADKLSDEKEVKCPACGRPIPIEAFQAHVQAERLRLQNINEIFDTRKAAIGTLCDTLKSIKSTMGKVELKPWREGLIKDGFSRNFTYIDELNIEAIRTSFSEVSLATIEDMLQPLMDVAISSSQVGPQDVLQLSTDNQLIETAKTVIGATSVYTIVAQVDALVEFLISIEKSLREEIRLRSRDVIEDISADIQAMWAILHPEEEIEDVHLYLPQETDKAIDIGLKFYGVELDSPRITLSEGYRNSLGLCIFLAMAKREKDARRPLLLDDVVVSLDRNHRGMIAELLEKEFSERQTIILTHDREWFSELRYQLDGNRWNTKALMPYETPALGIRWSHRTSTFDDARAQLANRPDSAGNDARKIMDVELSLIAERLQVKMPYLRGDRNDKRMAHNFIERLIADGTHCFQKRIEKSYETNTEAIAALEDADRLLLSWANRAAHSFDIVRPEAVKLIDTCEKALDFFKCPACGKTVWFADASSSAWVQCNCGEIRWRYGKA